MIKEYTALGLMSGTSGDGVDLSVIKSDGNAKYTVIVDKFFEYDQNIFNEFHNLKQKIYNLNDLKHYSENLKNLEKKITLFNAKLVNEVSKNTQIDLVGFHGQTIYHNSKEKISKQLGDGNLLFQLIKKNIVYNFRENDLQNGGEGAPLSPIFHQLILSQKKIKVPACLLNIGGISNVTFVRDYNSYNLTSRDIGPGNCLIDSWVRNNSNKKFDKDGILALKGKVNKIILEQAQELYSSRNNKNALSLDTNDFDVSFVRGLSLEDGSATLTEFTADVISAGLSSFLSKEKNNNIEILIAGGGRKNKVLVTKIKNKIKKEISLIPIDDYGINGDFVESQAFAFLAIRSLLGEPISFPGTTKCLKPITGGKIINL